jgi:ferredoxin
MTRERSDGDQGGAQSLSDQVHDQIEVPNLHGGSCFPACGGQPLIDTAPCLTVSGRPQPLGGAGPIGPCAAPEPGRERWLLGGRVGSHHHEPILKSVGEEDSPRGLWWRAKQRHVEVVRCQGGEKIVAWTGVEMDPRGRMPTMVGEQEPGNVSGADGFRHADAQRRGFPAGGVECVQEAGNFGEDPAGRFNKPDPILGEADASCGSVEEFDPEPGLNALNLSTHRALAQSQPSSGRRETAGRRDFPYHMQFEQVEGAGLFERGKRRHGGKRTVMLGRHQCISLMQFTIEQSACESRFMPNRDISHASNVPGPFYVDTTCIDCDLCRSELPSVFARDDESGFTFVRRQPSGGTEFSMALEAAERCPSESIGTD